MARRKAISGKKLYKILFYGVIIAVLAIGSLGFLGVREVRRDAARVAVENSAKGVSGAVSVLVDAVSSSNSEISIESLGSLAPDSLRANFSKTLTKHKNLIAIMLSDEAGLRYLLVRQADGWLEAVPQTAKDKSTRWAHISSKGTVSVVQPRQQFEPDTVNAALVKEFHLLKPGQANWRSTFDFVDDGESWITASTLIQSRGRKLMASYVFPIDVVIKYLNNAERGGAEKLFLTWESGKVLPVGDSSQMEGRDQGVNRVGHERDIDDPIISAATTLSQEAAHGVDTPFSFVAEGEVWWGYVHPLTVFGDTVSLGVAVPARNVDSGLSSDTFLEVFSGVLLLLAIVVLVVLHKNRARIEAVGLRQKAVQTPDELLELIERGESRSLEFKQTLRFNLKAGKNGKEIEHASMKTVAGFLNSDGGTLLVGVADDGSAVGFPEDAFESADKALLHFNNLVNQHIGTEFSRYIDTKVIEVNGCHVLRAYCMPAAAPAILINGKNEEFYVRSGPASRQLTLSQFYEWLQSH